MRTLCGQGRYEIANLLSMDVSDEFDLALRRRLVHNLLKGIIPEWVAITTQRKNRI